MGEFTQHNWRPRAEQVEVYKQTLRNGGDRREFITVYSRRCTRCGCVTSRAGWTGARYVEGQGFVSLIDNQGRIIPEKCPGWSAGRTT